ENGCLLSYSLAWADSIPMRPGLINQWPDWLFMQTELTWPGRTDLPGSSPGQAGFTYRGLSPHKFTPMPGVHQRMDANRDFATLHPVRSYAENLYIFTAGMKLIRCCFKGER
ncbi:MAG TPA: hypothetical protein VMW90_01470, partial [Acidobacteriota bacterium]|nr:hypothetical protein [Acidobacteriota bacterium]